MLNIQVVSHHFVRQNLITASEWFQIGSFCSWNKLKETKESEKLEKAALLYKQNNLYEQRLMTI